MNSEIPTEIQALLDKQAITEVIFRYARGYDRLDMETLAGVYWEDADDDFGMQKQGATIEEFFEFREKMDTHFIRQQHHISNVLIELDGEIATSESYFIFYALCPGPGPSPEGEMELTMGGRYIDQFEKRDGAWRILKRVRLADWNKQGPSTSDWASPLTASADRGLNFPEDKFYSLYRG